mgnify:CR=1 FL=1
MQVHIYTTTTHSHEYRITCSTKLMHAQDPIQARRADHVKCYSFHIISYFNFDQIQTTLSLTKFIDKYSNIYNTKLALLNQ